MASDADKTMSETEPRRGRRRPTAEVEETGEQKALSVGKGRATPGRRTVEEQEEKQSGNAITRTVTNLREYFDGVRTELQKVTWPTNEDTRRLSIIVLLTLLGSALILGAISFVFTELFRMGLSNPIILIVFMAAAIVVGLYITRITAKNS